MLQNKLVKKSKIDVKVVVVLIIIIIFIMCFAYSIIALFMNPTDTFMIENGKISESEETVRIFNKG